MSQGVDEELENKKVYVPVPISAVILNLVMGLILTFRVEALYMVLQIDDFERSSYSYTSTISFFQTMYRYFLLFVLLYILFNMLLYKYYKYKGPKYNITYCSRYITKIILITLIPSIIFLGIPFASGFLASRFLMYLR